MIDPSLIASFRIPKWVRFVSWMNTWHNKSPVIKSGIIQIKALESNLEMIVLNIFFVE